MVHWPSEGGLAGGDPVALFFALGQLTHIASSGYAGPRCWLPSCSSWACLFQLSLQSCSLSLSSILAQDLPAQFCSPGAPHWPPRMTSLTNPQVLSPSGDGSPSCSLWLRPVEKGDGAHKDVILSHALRCPARHSGSDQMRSPRPQGGE